MVETFPHPQRFLLGFQIKPASRLEEVLKCIQNLLRMNRSQPQFGVCVERITDPQIADDADMEMFDTQEECAAAQTCTGFAAAVSAEEPCTVPVFCCATVLKSQCWFTNVVVEQSKR